MKAESIVVGLAGILFGVIVGWILGSQQAAGTVRATPPAPAAQEASAPAQNRAQPAVLDQNRAQSLRTVAEQNPKDVQTRVELGNMYFDAEQFADAITWYEAALKINPADPNVSTDLGVAYYYTNQPDRAIKQFEHSLSVDPRHTKTLLNMGIVKAFGKQDIDGAQQAWEQVVALAPESPEGQAARKGLEGIRNAHGNPPPGSGSR